MIVAFDAGNYLCLQFLSSNLNLLDTRSYDNLSFQLIFIFIVFFTDSALNNGKDLRSCLAQCTHMISLQPCRAAQNA